MNAMHYNKIIQICMTTSFSYEILLNFKKIDIMTIRQASYYQIRVFVYQSDQKKNSIFAVPFLMLKSKSGKQEIYEKYKKQSSNVAQIDNSNGFSSQKFILRNSEQPVYLNDICLFKGNLSQNTQINREIKIYVQLLSFTQGEAETVASWQGFTLGSNGHSYCPIYFNSYRCTCCIQTTIHSIVSTVSLDKVLDENNVINQLKNMSNVEFYRKYSKELQMSMEDLKKQISYFEIKKSNKDFDKIEELNPQSYRYYGFRSNNQIKQLSQSQIVQVQAKINKLNTNDFIEDLRKSLCKLQQINYNYWKNLQINLINNCSEKYIEHLQSSYHQKIDKYHSRNTLKSNQLQKTQTKSQYSQLFLYPFEKHQVFLNISEEDSKKIQQLKRSTKKQLIVFVHGYQASSFDMEPISNYLRYKHNNIFCLLSSVNEGRTEQQIQESAHRLAIQIKNFINTMEIKDFQINFFAHSLGGLISRACLKYLQLHKDKFNKFFSLCSPHLGYLYHSSTLISTSLWILNKIKKDPSMIQLTLTDKPELDKTYLYGLSQGKQLNWFKCIMLFGSKQDEYVPYWSAMLEQKSFMIETQAAKVYKKMYENLTTNISDKIIRCQLIFNQKSKDLSNFIGRTAHIKILNYIPGIELISNLITF